MNGDLALGTSRPLSCHLTSPHLTSGKEGLQLRKEAPPPRSPTATRLAYSIAENLSRRLAKLRNKTHAPTNNRVDNGKFIGEYFTTLITPYVRSCAHHTNVADRL